MLLLVSAVAPSEGRAQTPKSDQTAPATPDAALAAYKAALDRRDVAAFANLTAGPPGVTLRKLAPGMKKAQEASDKLDRVLADKPALNFVNPFLDELNPLQGYQLEQVELTQDNRQYLARVRFGRAGKLNEESVSITQEGGAWRISLPGEFLKSVRRLTPERLERQVRTLTKLAEALNAVADEVAAGKLTTKEAILLRLATLVRDAKIEEK